VYRYLRIGEESLMTPTSEGEPVARSRTLRIVVLAAIVALVLIAALAVAAFLGLNLLRGPDRELDTGAGRPPIVAPVPTTIRPELFAPPSEWDDEVG
jgi:hypothetical protein